eukprot:15894858-Heterocapsa_arctica.AAC.1
MADAARCTSSQAEATGGASASDGDCRLAWQLAQGREGAQRVRDDDEVDEGGQAGPRRGGRPGGR